MEQLSKSILRQRLLHKLFMFLCEGEKEGKTDEAGGVLEEVGDYLMSNVVDEFGMLF